MRSLGDVYEAQAAALVAEEGLQLLARNFSCSVGEIDIIALDGTQLVFVEVRARSNRRYTSAAASVDKRKQQRIIRTAQWYLQQHTALSRLACRFDVIAFEPAQSADSCSFQWIRSAFIA